MAYFKANQLFYRFTFAEVVDDLHYLLTQMKLPLPAAMLAPLDKRTLLHHRQLILNLFRYRMCGPAERHHLAIRAQRAARLTSTPIFVFRDLLQYLLEQRIVLPGYSILQELVGKTLTAEQQRLIHLMQAHLTADERAACDALFADTDGLYLLTQLKHQPKDFTLGQIQQEIARADQLRVLYPVATRILPQLEIANEGITAYAVLVGYYAVFRLQQLDPWVMYLYLLCFVLHRYQQCHDHLLTCFLHIVAQATEEATVVAKTEAGVQRLERNTDVPKAGVILKLFTATDIAPTTPFQVVQSIAFKILSRQKLDQIADYISAKVHIDEGTLQWEQVDAQAQRLKRQLRPILLAIDLAATRADAPLLSAIQFVKTAFQKGRSLNQEPGDTWPAQFIPVGLRRYLYAPDETGQKRLIADRYEVLIYRQLRKGLESGELFCRDSVRFRSLEDDLISDQTWKAKDTLIPQTGLLILLQPIQDHLAALERQLETRLQTVNQRIADGDNPHFKIKRRGDRTGWTLQYPQGNEPINHAVFDTIPPVDVGRLLHFVNTACPFLACFDHILGRYVNQTPDESVLRACLVAWGTNMGLGRMGEISDIPYATLTRTSENFLRLETLHAANDCVSNAIAALPIFQYYQLGEVIHSSSDGQKFETRWSTINARNSPKYFGLQKGVVGYTLMANHIPVNARIIGAHEHESHFVFDLLMGNTTNVQPQIHSTDTHGTNHVNFVLLHMFNYQFAPRYKAIQDKVRTSLYGFHSPSQYGDLILKPVRKINTALIMEEWDNLQRIFVSLARKTTTQSIIVGKLSAYARKNRTRQALWEYDHILRSLYLLEFIDSPPLRQNVQRALNRVENYHQLRRAVSYANFGKLRFKTEDEQQVWNECCRLLTNCIIYYNASIISRLLASKEAAGDTAGVELLMQVSPVAWQHINFYGRYEFTKEPVPISLDAIVESLTERPFVETGDES